MTTRARLLVVSALVALAAPAHALYKCSSPSGAVTYQDEPCQGAAGATVGPKSAKELSSERRTAEAATAARAKAETDEQAAKQAQVRAERSQAAKAASQADLAFLDALYRVKVGMTREQLRGLNAHLLTFGRATYMEYSGGSQETRTFENGTTIVIDRDRVTFVHR